MEAASSTLENVQLNRLKANAPHIQKQLETAIVRLVLVEDQITKGTLESLFNNTQQQYQKIKLLLTDENATAHIDFIEHSIKSTINQLEAKYQEIDNADIRGDDKLYITETLLGDLKRAYSGWIELPPIPHLDIQAQRLRIEQQFLKGDIEREQQFSALLSEIKTKVSIKYPTVTCFICYAKPAENIPSEGWVPDFLLTFSKHLQTAGIVVSIDLQQGGFGRNTQLFREKIKDANFILLMGTESLLEWERRRQPDICGQLNSIQARYQKESALGRPSVIPILLNGTKEQAIPVQLRGDVFVEDFKTLSYVGYLKNLLRHLLFISEQDNEFNQLWQQFELRYPMLASVGFPEEEIKKYLDNEQDTTIQQESERKQLAMEMLNHMVERIKPYIPTIWNMGELKIRVRSLTNESAIKRCSICIKTAEQAMANINRELELHAGQHTLLAFADNVIAECDRQLSFIEDEVSNYPIKISATDIISNILTVFSQIKKRFDTTPITPINDQQLQIKEQQTKRELKQWSDQTTQLGKALLDALSKIQEFSSKGQWKIIKQCFISYAWPDANHADESWVNDEFLPMLKKHLWQAGIPTLLDRADSVMGGNIYHYMNKIQTSDKVLLIGTQSLLAKHNLGTTAVCNELILINRQRKQYNNDVAVIPLLMTGTYETSFPPYYEMYTNITDWRDASYIQNLKKLIRNLYSIGVHDETYNELWEELEKLEKIKSSSLQSQSFFSQVPKREEESAATQEVSSLSYS